MVNSSAATLHVRAIRDRLFLAAIDIIDMARDHGLEPEAQKWKWLLKGYHQYLPLAFLLTELCCRQESGEVARAWEVVERACRRWGGDIQQSKHEAILIQLMDKAKAHRSSKRQIQALDSYVLDDGPSDTQVLPEMTANALIESTAESFNSLPSFLVDEVPLDPAEFPSLDGDVSAINHLEQVTGFGPISFDATDWIDMAPHYGTPNDGLQGFELRDASICKRSTKSFLFPVRILQFLSFILTLRAQILV
jgi:hypothetical protein